jgi:hypothetical protein
MMALYDTLFEPGLKRMGVKWTLLRRIGETNGGGGTTGGGGGTTGGGGGGTAAAARDDCCCKADVVLQSLSCIIGRPALQKHAVVVVVEVVIDCLVCLAVLLMCAAGRCWKVALAPLVLLSSSHATNCCS